MIRLDVSIFTTSSAVLTVHKHQSTPTMDGTLISTLSNAPHTFLQPSPSLYADGLAYLQHALDPLAANVSVVQEQRLRETRKKRKRNERAADADILRIKRIHVDGFEVDQIWQQARRVIDAARSEVERTLAESANRDVVAKRAEDAVNGHQSQEESDARMSGLSEESEDMGSSDASDVAEDVEWEDEEELDEAVGGEVDAELGQEDDDLDAEMLTAEDASDEPAEEVFVPDKFGLNDGFFSIDQFNRNSEFLEQRDVQGETDADSDEEDVDWDANPLSQPLADTGATQLDDEGDDEDGPTFGDPDAPSEDDNELEGGDMEGPGVLSNANDVMYSDFFAPPASKKRKGKKGRPNPHNFPPSMAPRGTEEEPDPQRTMAAVHRDLFEGESDEEEGEPDPTSRQSTHERRQAALALEIRRLEAANVAKRQWTLSGEARAADRPVNSLLEEVVDFDRTGKPVPVITAQVSQDVEALIRRRILAHDFQNIPRRRPTDLAAPATTRRPTTAVDIDSRPTGAHGLADEYEQDHRRRTDPHFVDAAEQHTLAAEHDIAAQWHRVAAALDALCTQHARPRAPSPQLIVRSDAPVAALEEARPGGGDATQTQQLAPQELVAPAASSAHQVVGRSGLPTGREELSRDEKRRRRRREKARRGLDGATQRGDASAGAPKPSKRDDQKSMLARLRKGGATVVGRDGDVRDLQGREVGVGRGGKGTGTGTAEGSSAAAQGGGRWKL